MARGCEGAMARWRDGAMARWRDGAMARWRGGATLVLAQKFESNPFSCHFDASSREKHENKRVL
jgi:hypothetical protein